MDKKEYFFNVTEASMLTGIDRKGIYNRCNQGGLLVSVKRRGRKFDEMVIRFDYLLSISPAFSENHREMMLALYTTIRSGELAFRIIEVSRLLSLSSSWIHQKVSDGKLPTITASRGLRKTKRKDWTYTDERLILAKDLGLFKDVTITEDDVLDLFTLEPNGEIRNENKM